MFTLFDADYAYTFAAFAAATESSRRDVDFAI